MAEKQEIRCVCHVVGFPVWVRLTFIRASGRLPTMSLACQTLSGMISAYEGRCWPKSKFSLLLLLLGIGFAGWLQVLQAAPAVSTLADFRTTYERELAKIRTNNAPILAADANYMKYLASLAADAKKQGDFDSTMALICERKRFEVTRMVPDASTNLPTAIVKVQGEYRAALALAESVRTKQNMRLNAAYVKSLKNLIKMYLVDEKMDEAEAVNKEIKQVEAKNKLAEATLPAILSTEMPIDDGKPEEPDDAAGAGTAGKGNPRKWLSGDLRKGLQLYYSFDDDSLVGVWCLDDTVNDVKGGIQGAWRGAACYEAQGHAGARAAVFSGNASCIDVGNQIRLGCTQRFTLSAWVNIRQINSRGKYGPLVSMNAGDANRFSASLAVDGDHDGRVKFTVDKSGVGSNAAYAAERPAVNVWHHYVGVYDTRTVTLYVDGVRQSSVPYTYGNLADPVGSFTIGPYNGADWSVFYGAIADVAVWKRALSLAEILSLYQASNGNLGVDGK